MVALPSHVLDVMKIFSFLASELSSDLSLIDIFVENHTLYAIVIHLSPRSPPPQCGLVRYCVKNQGHTIKL